MEKVFNQAQEEHGYHDHGNVHAQDYWPEMEKVEDLPDGSSVYQMKEERKEREESGDFHENLAEHLDEGTLSSLAVKLLEQISDDRKSRDQWESTTNLVLKYIGLTVEEFRDTPFMRACSAFDSTLSTALQKAYATIRAELLPAEGPSNVEILGKVTTESEDIAERMKAFFNYYLTIFDEDYYPDFERMIFYVAFFGCAFKKVYIDPVTNNPTARFVKPQDIIIDNNCTTILSSSRITQVMYLTRKEIISRKMAGVFRDTSIPDIEESDDGVESPTKKTIKKIEGINTEGTENKSLFEFYECHAELDLSKDDKHAKEEFPSPYILTICVTNKKIMSIRRNWKENDEERRRIECFVHYYYLPGFGMYGLGMCQLGGSNAIALSNILRQLIDAGTLKNFPGGLKSRGMKSENNDRAIGPGEWLEVDTGGQPISECISPMPYAGADMGLNALREALVQNMQESLNAASMQLSESNSNAPVGTTIALLDENSKVQSTILRSMRFSLGRELKLLFELFKDHFEDQPYPFEMVGAEHTLMKSDFDGHVNIVPISDPNVMTRTQRIIRAESVSKLAAANPAMHNMYAIQKRLYQALNIPNIEEILPPPEEPKPLDATSENVMISVGKQVLVADFQDDDAHIAVHKKFLGELPNLAQLYPTITTMMAALQHHIQVHEAFKGMKSMQQQTPNMDVTDIDAKNILEAERS